jgi:hypothetical protein
MDDPHPNPLPEGEKETKAPEILGAPKEFDGCIARSGLKERYENADYTTNSGSASSRAIIM